MLRSLRPVAISMVCLLITACGNPAPAPGETTPEPSVSAPTPPQGESQPDDPALLVDPEPAFPTNFRAIGTEPFWAVHVNDDRLRYMTPENQQGEQADLVREQAPLEETAITAELGERDLILTGRIEECSDGMSDRVYPYTVTLRLGDQTMQGCARTTEP